MKMNSFDEGVPLPSEPILSEEETAKQVREDMLRPLREENAELRMRLDRARGIMSQCSRLLESQCMNPTPSLLVIREVQSILQRKI